MFTLQELVSLLLIASEKNDFFKTEMPLTVCIFYGYFYVSVFFEGVLKCIFKIFRQHIFGNNFPKIQNFGLKS